MSCLVRRREKKSTFKVKNNYRNFRTDALLMFKISYLVKEIRQTTKFE